MTGRVTRVALSAPFAVCLALVIAGGAMAATWSGPIALTSSGSGFGFGIVGLNGTTAIATLDEYNNNNGYNVLVRRSTTSGSSWDVPQTLSTDGYGSAISGLDPFVDVIWTQDNRVRYTRSVDGGMSFSPSVAISPKNLSLTINLSVARGPGGVVVAAWQNAKTFVIKVRVSTDGGVTFGPITNFASNVQDMGTSVAVGDGGVVYLAYKLEYVNLRVVRSTDGGVTWNSPFVATNDGFGVVNQFSVTAEGTHAYLAYAVHNAFHPNWGAIRYRQTLDGGASWGVERKLTPPKWKVEFPVIELKDGVVRAVYERRASGDINVYYQESADGLNWSTGELVDAGGHGAFVTHAGNIIVLYEVGTGDAYVRTGS